MLLNKDQCRGENLMHILFTFQDFNHTFRNPFFLAYSNVPSNTTDIMDNKIPLQADSCYMIAFTACYAYSIFRVFMDLTKILYSYKKIDIIFSDKKNQEIINEKDYRGNKPACDGDRVLQEHNLSKRELRILYVGAQFSW